MDVDMLTHKGFIPHHMFMLIHTYLRDYISSSISYHPFRSPHAPDSPEVQLPQGDEVADGPGEGSSAIVADVISPGTAVAGQGEGVGR